MFRFKFELTFFCFTSEFSFFLTWFEQKEGRQDERVYTTDRHSFRAACVLMKHTHKPDF